MSEQSRTISTLLEEGTEVSVDKRDPPANGKSSQCGSEPLVLDLSVDLD